jgi:DNA-binding MarR family transcriptional regulator
MLAGRQLVATLEHVKAPQEDPSEIPARLRRAIGRLNRRLRVTRAGADLTPSKYEVLATVVRQGPLRQSDVATIEGLNPTMLSRIVGNLDDAGLLTRLADSADGRVVHVAATKLGRDLVARIRNERSDALSLALTGLTDTEYQTLLAALPVLESLAENLVDRPR